MEDCGARRRAKSKTGPVKRSSSGRGARNGKLVPTSQRVAGFSQGLHIVPGDAHRKHSALSRSAYADVSQAGDLIAETHVTRCSGLPKQRVWRRSDPARNLVPGAATFPRETASRCSRGTGWLCCQRTRDGLLGRPSALWKFRSLGLDPSLHIGNLIAP